MAEEKSTMRQELGRLPQYMPSQNELTVLLKNGRLDVTANVDRHGLGELIAMLGQYQEVMTRLGEWNRVTT